MSHVNAKMKTTNQQHTVAIFRFGISADQEHEGIKEWNWVSLQASSGQSSMQRKETKGEKIEYSRSWDELRNLKQPTNQTTNQDNSKL